MKIDDASKAEQLLKRGNADAAAKLCKSLLKRNPSNFKALSLLASALFLQGDYKESERFYKRAISIRPDDVDSLYNLSLLYLRIKTNLVESERLLRKVIALSPGHAGALNNLGLYMIEHCKDATAALLCFQETLSQHPENLDALFNSGCAHLALNEPDEAASFFMRTLDLDPRHIGALNNLGVLHVRKGRRDLALPYYQRAMEMSPDDTEIMANLLITAMATGDTRLALELFRSVCAMPDSGVAIFPAYSFAKMVCFWKEVDALLPEVVRRILDGRCTLSSFETVNLPLLATPQISRQTLFDIHRKSGEVIVRLGGKAAPINAASVGTPASRLNVGYLSPDFRSHVVNVFIRGLINHHDRDHFKIHCYSNSLCEDGITEQYRRTADVFTNVTDLSDEQLAARIRADQIHVLVDLAGYTQNSRTPALRLRAAPVQVMYLGYPYTSGIPEVDYFVSDPWLDGPINADFFTERQLRLPESFITFDSLHEQCIDPVVPLDRNGHVTFGSMNGPYKLTPEAVATWARVLQAAQDSRMIINHPNCALAETRQRILDEFTRCGVSSGRVSIVWDKHPSGSHLRYYNDFDVMLDTFPQTGGTTTIDAVWMGVPVVTLVGEIFHQRLSYSVLNNIGIGVGDLIAFTKDEYVEKAVALANNPDRIRELHRAIPQALKTSILCDPIHFTRHMEAALVEGWNRKFPDHAFSLEIRESLRFFPVPGGVEIPARDSLDDLDAYVLQEQAGSFEAEYRFVLDFLQPGMRMVDVGSGNGLYAIPAARKVAPRGRVWSAALTPGDGRRQQLGVEHNRIENLRLMLSGDRKLMLDEEMPGQELSGIDFVRFNLNVRDEMILQNSFRFCAANSPLIMFGVKRDNSVVDTAFAAIFKEYGYDIYRLVPGLGALAPFAADEELDAFAMNLFACKPDRAAMLEAGGWLARRMAPQAELPGIHAGDWQNYLAGLPYAAGLLPGWLAASAKPQDWEVYWVALNLFAQAKDGKREMSRRCACLQTAGGILIMLAQSAPRLPRLLSLCRVLAELGRREMAVGVLDRVSALFDSGAELDVDEPFLALTDEFAAMQPGDRLAEWLFASVLEQREKLRAFSTFFTGQESLAVLEAVRGTGFQSKETERRIELIRQRSQQLGAQPEA